MGVENGGKETMRPTSRAENSRPKADSAAGVTVIYECDQVGNQIFDFGLEAVYVALYICQILPSIFPFLPPVIHIHRTGSRCTMQRERMRRGRSRTISTIALARQASEERRLSLLITATTTSPSPPSTTHTTSLPCTKTPVPILDLTTSNNHEEQHCVYPASPTDSLSSTSSTELMAADMQANLSSSDSSSLPPPRTLQDQLHVAYALDDIHLAKIILLKLRGIEVTSDSDPRIAAVQPEDFDECFIPAGGLMSQEDEEVIKEMQRVERERLQVAYEQRRRREREEAESKRLREWELHCEKIWEGEKRRMREEKEFLERKREEERKRWEDTERRRREAAERRATATSRYSCRSSPVTTKSKPRLSYASLSIERIASSSSSMSSTGDDKYLYSVLPVPKVPSPPSRRRPSGTSPPSGSSSTSHGSASCNSSHTITPSHDPTLGNGLEVEVATRKPNTSVPSSTIAHKDRAPLDSKALSLRGRLSPSCASDMINITVSFRDILTSMRGPLFPIETEPDSRPRPPRAESMDGNQSQSPNSCRSQSKGRVQDPSLPTNVTSTHTARRRRRNEELLSLLLTEVKWAEGERLARGRSGNERGKSQKSEKGKERTLQPLHPIRQNSSSSIRSSSSTSSCAACSASASSNAPTSPASISSGASRAGSWLSSFSSSSTNTDLTTLSTSLSTSPSKVSLVHVQHVCPSTPTSNVKSTVTGWLRKSAITGSSQQHQAKESQQRQAIHLVHSCRRPPFSGLTPIMAFDGPLCPDDTNEPKGVLSIDGAAEGSDEVGSRVNTKRGSSGACANDGISIHGPAGIARQMTRFVELAKGFQTAYINMTVFGAVPTLSYDQGAWNTGLDDEGSPQRNKAKRRRDVTSWSQAAVKQKLQPAGYRASKAEIDLFLIRRNDGGVRKEKEGILRAQLNSETTANHTSLSGTASNEASAEGEKIVIVEHRGRSVGRCGYEYDDEDGIEYIPLLPPQLSAHPPKTILPSPLPYPVVFKPPLPLVPSPHRRVALRQNQRLEDGMEFGSLSALSSYSHPSLVRGTGRFSSRLSSSPPPRSSARSRGSSRSNSHSPTRRSSLSRLQNPQESSAPVARPRVVANPVYLRLKAAKNVGLELGKNWEPGLAKSCGRLSGGKEKMLALTWDEMGRSVLGREQDETFTRRGCPVKGTLDTALRSGGGILPDRGDDDRRRGRHGRDVHEFQGVRRGRCVVRG
ncbi:hypothetical protein E1B28_001668 [Marasmius oreades]|uniref:Uncharacterized protein n=1 Tax=Marasmius oreades TaxID=181124 RepID=A0A9P7V3V9_9AGAR|nr:uncharacterized protein E1B28_001668 [Marasmius oreades]KAG7099864.1 hypothetical protein E1B28_001668 [Marasmius oreades]